MKPRDMSTHATPLMRGGEAHGIVDVTTIFIFVQTQIDRCQVIYSVMEQTRPKFVTETGDWYTTGTAWSTSPPATKCRRLEVTLPSSTLSRNR